LLTDPRLNFGVGFQIPSRYILFNSMPLANHGIPYSFLGTCIPILANAIKAACWPLTPSVLL
jgi:hypothetical protein